MLWTILIPFGSSDDLQVVPKGCTARRDDSHGRERAKRPVDQFQFRSRDPIPGHHLSSHGNGTTREHEAVSFQAIYKNSFDPSGAKNGSGTFTITPPTGSFTGVLKQLSDQIFFVLDEPFTIQVSAKSGGPAGTPVSGVNERINQAGVPIDNCNFTTTGLRTHTALSVTPPAQRDENGWRIPVSAFN